MSPESDKIDDLVLVYIRHNMDSNPEIYKKLIENKWIAVHYEGLLISKDRKSTDPDDYEGQGRHVLKRLWGYCESGALVAADFSKYPPAKMLVGRIPSGSKIEPMIFPPSEEGEVNKENYPEGATYRVVKLEDAVIFDYAEHPILRTAQPPGGGVVVRWKKIERHLKVLYKKKLGIPTEIPPTVYDLDFAQLEVLCSEYLRRALAPPRMRVDYFLTPVGRGKKDTDIDGASRNARVLGQASFSSDIKEIEKKIENLRSFAKEYNGSKRLVLVYFGPKECEPPKSQLKEIEYVPIEKVFDKMRETGIVEDMLP